MKAYNVCLLFVLYATVFFAYGQSSEDSTLYIQSDGVSPDMPVGCPTDQYIQDLTFYLEQDRTDGGKLYDTVDGFNNPTARALGEKQSPVILFINGVMTTQVNFAKGVQELKKLINDEFPEGTGDIGFYNVSATQTVDEAFACLVCENINYGDTNWDVFVYETCLARLAIQGPLADYGQSSFQFLGKMLVGGQYVDQTAVTTLRDTLRMTVEAGRKVIIVAHSQGNFFVRDALLELSKESYGKRYLQSIGVVMVGSPVPLRDIHDNVSAEWVEACTDSVAALTKIKVILAMFVEAGKAVLKSHAYESPLSGQECVESDKLGLRAHNFIDHYLTHGALREEIVKAIKNLDDNTLVPRVRLFAQNDAIKITDDLKVRSSSDAYADNSNLLYVVGSNSTGYVNSIEEFGDGYIWYDVCFDSGTFSLDTGSGSNDVSGQCGFVASNWLEFDPTNPPADHDPNPVMAYNQSEIEIITRDNGGILAVSGGLILDPPDANDEISGFGGCSDCTSAPSQFEMTTSTVACAASTMGGEATLNWYVAPGADSYNVYRDGELVVSGLTASTYIDPLELELGKSYLYFIKALNASGTRNADTSWNPEVDATLCGDPEPPAPYSGPVPTVATQGVTDLEVFSARLNEVVNPNGVGVDTYYEYGLTDSFGSNTPLYAQGSGTDPVEWSQPITGLTCDTTYYYRVVGEYIGATLVVYGDTLTFTTPECASSAPTNLAISHDVNGDALVLTWDEPILSYLSKVVVERKIVSDPRPGVMMGVWEEYSSGQNPKYETWSDSWLGPQPGAEYCYRISTWNVPAGAAGYSPYSNEACITVEGVFTQQVDFPQGPYPETTPDVGMDVVATGGIGVFNIERRQGEEVYTTVGNADSSGGINWMDTDVISGEMYCYRFEQYGQTSMEACQTYYDVAAIGVPSLLSLTADPDPTVNSVHLEWTSAVTDQGSYELERYADFTGSFQWSGAGSTTALAMDTARYAEFDDIFVCFRLRQNIHGTYTAYSNTLCMSEGETYIDPSTNNPNGRAVIGLTGANPFVVMQGDMFVDSGFTATDPEDGDITASIVVAGDTVDTATLGTYVITYDVTDSGGRSAVQMTRNVEVKQYAPVITLVGNNPAVVPVGETYTDPGATATDVEDGDVTALVVTGGDTVDTATAGIYTVTYDVTDSYGDSATQVTRAVHVIVVIGNNTHSVSLDRSQNQTASITDASQTGLTLSDTFTLEGWVKLSSDPGLAERMSLLEKDDAYGIFYSRNKASDGGVFQLFCEHKYTGGSINEFRTDYTLSVGTWYHIACTRDAATGTNRMYVNGVEVEIQTGTNTGQSLNAGDDFRLGGVPWESRGGYFTLVHFDGTLDDVRVWNTVRTVNEIALNSQTELVGTEAGLVGYWKLNNNTTDTTTNGNDLTPVNTPTYAMDVSFSTGNTVPVITLSGDDPLTLTQGDAFVDPGATAMDTEDGDLSGSVVAAGTVDTNTIGTYIRTYDVVDLGGLSATQVTRTVDVIASPITNTHSADVEKDSSQYFSIADNSQTGLDVTGDMTIEIMVKPEAQPPNGNQFGILGKDAQGQRSYALAYRHIGGVKDVTFFAGSNGATFEEFVFTQILPTAAWTHIAITFDASTSTVELFINGTSVGTVVGTITSLFNGTAGLNVGRFGEYSQDLWDGMIDDVRIWSDVRTAQEITDNKDSELTGTEANLVGYWKLNNDATDATANNNSLTGVNGATFTTDVP